MNTRFAFACSLLTALLLGGGPARAQETKPFAAMSESAIALRDSVVSLARAQVGTKYVFGGENPGGFDCSGLVRFVMAALDLETPRTASQQATLGSAVVQDTKTLRPGDLLTFSNGNKNQISHIGIYVGDGRYVHASSKAGQVVESPIRRQATTLITIWRGARRLVALIDPSEGAGWKLPPARRPQPSIVARKIPPPSIFVTVFAARNNITPAALFKTVPVRFTAQRAAPAPAQARRTA
jgi:hypothetical protein